MKVVTVSKGGKQTVTLVNPAEFHVHRIGSEYTFYSSNEAIAWLDKSMGELCEYKAKYGKLRK
jgi:hypothetical protein